MTRNRFQTILAAAVLIITALPAPLQAYWGGGRSTWSGCNMCLCTGIGADCDNPEHRNHSSESVSGIIYSGDGTPVRYQAACCTAVPRCFRFDCGFGELICSTDLWAEYGIGDMCGEQYTGSLSISEWICPTVRLSGMKNPLSPGDTVTVTAYGMETAGGSPV